jgi:hypothetical protein
VSCVVFLLREIKFIKFARNKVKLIPYCVFADNRSFRNRGKSNAILIEHDETKPSIKERIILFFLNHLMLVHLQEESEEGEQEMIGLQPDHLGTLISHELHVIPKKSQIWRLSLTAFRKLYINVRKIEILLCIHPPCIILVYLKSNDIGSTFFY